MEVGLVLGGGGVVGAAWMVGALKALEEESGFRAHQAKRVLGTSAGSLVGALGAAGVSPEEMAESAIGTAAHLVGSYRDAGRPPFLIGSPGLAASMLRRQRDRSVTGMLMGLLPRGVVNTEPIHRLVDKVLGGDWPANPSLRVVACDYASGQRVTFGSDWAPRSTVGTAVAASCAIPAFFRPVTIGERDYIDGGIHSHSNLDMIAGEELDIVVCLSPLSSRAPLRATTMLERIVAARRRRSAAILIKEARALKRRGIELIVLEPGLEDLRAMGVNPMARDRAERVIETARASVTRTLRRLPLTAELPAAVVS
jgi:NTE family protein